MAWVDKSCANAHGIIFPLICFVFRFSDKADIYLGEKLYFHEHHEANVMWLTVNQGYNLC